MEFIDLSAENNSPQGIKVVRNVMLGCIEYQNYIPLMVSDDENHKNLSEYLTKKAKYESFKTSVNKEDEN